MYVDNNNGEQQASDLESSFPVLFLNISFNSKLIQVTVNESNKYGKKNYTKTFQGFTNRILLSEMFYMIIVYYT